MKNLFIYLFKIIDYRGTSGTSASSSCDFIVMTKWSREVHYGYSETIYVTMDTQYCI